MTRIPSLEDKITITREQFENAVHQSIEKMADENAEFILAFFGVLTHHSDNVEKELFGDLRTGDEDNVN